MDKIEIKELKNLPCILVAEGSQKEIEEDFFREIYGIENEIIFADTVDDARLLVLSNQGFLPVFGGSLSEEYHDKISRIPLYHNKKPFRRNFCAFNRIDNSGFLIEEFIDILKSQFNKEI